MMSVPRRSSWACRPAGPRRRRPRPQAEHGGQRAEFVVDLVGQLQVGTSTRPRGRRATRVVFSVAVRISSSQSQGLARAGLGPPRTSRPARASGRAWAWIGRGVVMPRRVSAAVRGSRGRRARQGASRRGRGEVAVVAVVGVASGTRELRSGPGRAPQSARRRADDLRREAGVREQKYSKACDDREDRSPSLDEYGRG